MLSPDAMMQTLIASIVAFAIGAPAGFAQAPRTALSGTWRMDVSRSGSPGHQDFKGPVVRVIRYSPAALVIEHTAGTETTTLEYPLTEVRPEPALGAARGNLGYWDGTRLITETVQNISGQTVTMKETWSLSPDGRELSVERLVEVEHGYTIRDGQNYSTVKDVFVKADP